MEPNSEFGRLLREARKARGKTLSKLAEETGFSRGTFSKLENGVYDRPPSERLITAVSKALGLDTAELMNARNAYSPTPVVERVPPNLAKTDRDRTVEDFYIAESPSALIFLSDPPLERALVEAVNELVRAAKRGLDAHQPSPAQTLLELAKNFTHSRNNEELRVADLEIEMLLALARSRLRSRQNVVAKSGDQPDVEFAAALTTIGLIIAKTSERERRAGHVWFLVLKELAALAARMVHIVVGRPSIGVVLSWPQVNKDILRVTDPERFIVEPPTTKSGSNETLKSDSLDESLIRRRIVAEAEIALSLFCAAFDLEPTVLEPPDQLRNFLIQAHWDIERAIVMRDIIRLRSFLTSKGYSVNPDDQRTNSWCEDKMRQTILEVRQRCRSLIIKEEILEVRSFLAYAHLELGFLLRTRENESGDIIEAFWNFTLSSLFDPLFDGYVRIQLKEIWARLSGNNSEYVKLERRVERKLAVSDLSKFDYDF